MLPIRFVCLSLFGILPTNKYSKGVFIFSLLVLIDVLLLSVSLKLL